MARTNVLFESKEIKNELKPLDDLVNEYFFANTNKNTYTKLAKEKNEQIKQLMTINQLKEFEGSQHKVKLSESQSISYDDEKLLTLVERMPEEIKNEIIEIVPTVNMQKLERAIIENKINVESLKDAQITSVVTKLTIK